MRTFRPKYWRKRAQAAETRNVLLRHEADTLRRDRDAYAGALAAERQRTFVLQGKASQAEGVTVARLRGEVARLRDTVAALDQRNDTARREVAWWHDHHSACERARQMAERDAEAARAAAELAEEGP